MKYSDLSTKSRHYALWTKLAAASLLSIALAGCGGSDGATGATGPAGPPGPAGPAGGDQIVVVNVGSNATPAAPEAQAAWKALEPKIAITSVTISSAPVVKFTVKDGAGLPVVGLANYSQGTATTSSSVKALTNVSFSLAKLVRGANNEPSKWVSYNVVRPPTNAEKTATPANRACDAATNAAWCGTYPAADSQGTLVDHKDGSYTYTFYRDPKQAATLVASLNDSADGLSKKADLGDVAFDANATTRVGIMITGNAPGTGTNNPTASATGYPAAVAMALAGNAVYDFIPATGNPVVVADASRDIVNIDTCASCHQKKGIGHGTRRDPKLCVTCHTDQTKYSYAEATKAGTVYSGRYGKVGGESAFTFPRMVHQYHMGDRLVNTGYNLNNHCNTGTGANLSACFNQVSLPQDVRNCTVCHDGAATVAAKKTVNGDNWKTAPSILACGSCHDGINFATGGGITLADRNKDVAAKVPVGTTQTGHVGGAKTDNATCVLCHAAADVIAYHPAKLPATAAVSKRTMSATISSVVVSETDGSVTAKFSMTDGSVAVTDPAKFVIGGFSLSKLVPGANGAPSQWVSYTSRFRSKSAAREPVLTGNKEPGDNTTIPGTLTANADGSFSYKFALINARIPGDIRTIEHTHVLRTTALPAASTTINGWTYDAATKLWTGPANAAGVRPAAGTGWNVVAYEPALTHRIAMEFTNAAKTVDNATNAYKDFVPGADGKGTGTVATTRNIVTMENCSSCHAGQKLHEGYATQLCVTCHNATASDPTNGLSIDLQNVVHRIHAKGPAYVVNGESFNVVGYPGLIKNCAACHVETNTAAKDAANWRTVPYKRACASCHDAATAVAHMDSNITSGVETCVTCHGAGKVADVKAVHGQ